MDVQFIIDLSKKLAENEYSYLNQYIHKLTKNQLDNFCIWAEAQLPDTIVNVSSLSEEQIIEIIEIFTKQERYMAKANWNWAPFENSEYTYTLKDGNFVKNKKSMFSWYLAKLYMNVLAFGVLIAGFSYIFAVTFGSNSINETNLRFIDQSLGNIYGIINTIIGFYFGGAFNSLTNEKQ